MEAPASSTEKAPPPERGKTAKARPARKPSAPPPGAPPPAETPPSAPARDGAGRVAPLEVLRETFPGLAALLVVTFAVLAAAIALAIGQPYAHREQAATWTEADFWLERRPAGDGEPGLLARADFYLRPAADAVAPLAESSAVALLEPTADSMVLLARPDGDLLLHPVAMRMQTGLDGIRAIAYAESSQIMALLDRQGVVHFIRADQIETARRQQAGDKTAQTAAIDLRAENFANQLLPAAATSLARARPLLVSVTDDGEIESFDLAVKGFGPVGRRETGADLDSVAITPDAARGVAGAADGRLVLFTPRSAAERAILVRDAHAAPVSAVAIADGGAAIVSADASGRVRIGNGDGDRVAGFAVGDGGVAGLALSADGERILTAGGDGWLRLWRRDGSEIGSGQRVAERIADIAAAPALDFVALAGSGVGGHRFDLVQLNTRPSWFALFAFAFAGGLFFAFLRGFVRAEAWIRQQRAAAEPAPVGRVRAFLTSDGPVSDPRYAGRALNELSRRLFRFLANRDTAAPVTLALTAEWGMGKSSAMRLLQRRLEEQGMPTVWFNAWHHQKEEQLFASLMEQIRRQATPSIARLEFFHPRNLKVRLRLLQTRLVDKPLRVLLFLGLLVFLVTVLVDAPASLVGSWTDTVTALGAAGAAFIAFQNLFKPFAQSPLNLVQSWGGWFAPTRFRNLLGVRDQFAEAFDEVSRALGPERRLTIFIDDLDRCQKQQVVDVLEAVNFLVSTAECYIVLGVSERPVKNAVGLMFKELAAAHALDSRENGAAGDDEDADERVRALKDQQQFADSYLEKLINIRISIPPFDTEALRHWLEVADSEAAAADDPRPARPWLRAAGWTARALVVSAVLAVAVIGGSQVDLDGAQETVVDTATPPASSDTGGAGAGTKPVATAGNAGDPGGPSAAGSDAGTPAGTVTPAVADVHAASLGWLNPRWAPLMLLLLLALALLAFVPRRSRRWLGELTAVVQPIADLDVFKQAMESCLPAVLEARQSPRAIKRFVNRMRFLTADLAEADAELVADLVAIATAHEIGLVSGRDSPHANARTALLERIGGYGRAERSKTWPDAVWRAYWDLFDSASFGGGESEDEAETGAAPAAAAP